MKNFDFVSFTVWFALLLLVAFVGGDLFLKYELSKMDDQLATCEKELRTIGENCAKISALDQQIRDDKMVQESAAPYRFFQKMAHESGIGISDLSMGEDKEKVQNGYQDYSHTIEGKSTVRYPRRALVQMMQLVEKNSSRVRTVAADFSLDSDEAEKDLWRAKFTFLRREPLAAPTQ